MKDTDSLDVELKLGEIFFYILYIILHQSEMARRVILSQDSSRKAQSGFDNGIYIDQNYF